MIHQILKLSTLTLIPLSLSGCAGLSLLPSPWTSFGLLAFVGIAIAGIAGLGKKVRWTSSSTKEDLPDLRFDEEHITHTFIASLPKLTEKMSLEVASSKQTEVFEKSHSRRFLGIDLGTNSARLTVPVTYHFHIRLCDPWKLQVSGDMLVVFAPPVRCSVPPAIHTDEIHQNLSRGWARSAPGDLAQELYHDLTPTLTQFANDERRIEWVRDTCRRQVAEFIRRWLAGENRWRPGKFTAIQVRFANEPVLPGKPTVQLLSFK